MEINLTDEEKELLILLGSGEMMRTSSQIMGIHPNVLREIKRSAMEKLGARNHVHAIFLALLQGLIKVPD